MVIYLNMKICYLNDGCKRKNGNKLYKTWV